MAATRSTRTQPGRAESPTQSGLTSSLSSPSPRSSPPGNCLPQRRPVSTGDAEDRAAELKLVAWLEPHAAGIAGRDPQAAPAAQQERRISGRLVEQEVAAERR